MSSLWIAIAAALAAASAIAVTRRRARRRAADDAARRAEAGRTEAEARAAQAARATAALTEAVALQVADGHLRDGARCWTFVSGGFGAHAHPELVLTVVRDDADQLDDVQEHALVLMRSFLHAVTRGTRFTAWMSADLGGGNFGRDDLRGIALIPAIGPDDVALPAGALALLVLTADEAAIARSHGAAAVAALLGNHYRHYPTAWWFDRGRRSLAAGLGRSAIRGEAIVLPGVTTLQRVRGAIAIEPDGGAGHAVGSAQHFDPLEITVDAEAAPLLAAALAQLRPGQATLIATAPSPDADGRLVWVPGNTRTAITGPDGGRAITGSFVAFSLVDTADPGAGVVESGFVIALDGRGRDQLTDALAAARPLDVTDLPADRRWRLAHARTVATDDDAN